MHLLLLILFLPFMAIHFLPTIVAASRSVRNLGWIFVINLFLGWTVVGWVVALIWAFRDLPRYAPVYIPPPPYNR